MAEFVTVCSINDIKAGTAKKVSAKGKEIALFNIQGKIYGIGAVCSHAQGPLDEGTIEGTEVECPFHGARFDVTTGKNVSPPAPAPVEKFEVKIEGTDVKVKV